MKNRKFFKNKKFKMSFWYGLFVKILVLSFILTRPHNYPVNISIQQTLLLCTSPFFMFHSVHDEYILSSQSVLYSANNAYRKHSSK